MTILRSATTTKAVTKYEMYGLIEAYGYEKQLEDLENYRTRFKSEDGFLDLWVGRKRITIGIYMSDTKVMRYKRVYTLEQLEDWLQAD